MQKHLTTFSSLLRLRHLKAVTLTLTLHLGAISTWTHLLVFLHRNVITQLPMPMVSYAHSSGIKLLNPNYQQQIHLTETVWGSLMMLQSFEAGSGPVTLARQTTWILQFGLEKVGIVRPQLMVKNLVLYYKAQAANLACHQLRWVTSRSNALMKSNIWE